MIEYDRDYRLAMVSWEVREKTLLVAWWTTQAVNALQCKMLGANVIIKMYTYMHIIVLNKHALPIKTVLN